MSKEYPGLWSPTIDGKQYAYIRANRAAKAIRITTADGSHPLPGDPAFVEAYQRALAVAPTERATPHRRSLSALIASYKRDCEHWPDLSPVTQRAYLRRFDVLEAAFGGDLVNTIDRVRVLAMRKHFVTHKGRRVPSRGNEAVKALGVLLLHAYNIGWVKENPAMGVDKLRTGGGYRMWTAADFATFMAHPGINEALKRAVVLAYYSGLRISDLVALPRTARQDGVIRGTTQKTGARFYVPEHPELTRWLDSAPDSDAKTLLQTPTGRPWTKDHLEHSLAKATRLAGLDGLSCHGLRMALTSRLAEAGASEAQIGAVIPHSAAMTAFYRRQADQTALASNAMAKLAARRVSTGE
jgi:enterobacteria phage integrase